MFKSIDAGNEQLLKIQKLRISNSYIQYMPLGELDLCGDKNNTAKLNEPALCDYRDDDDAPIKTLPAKYPKLAAHRSLEPK